MSKQIKRLNCSQSTRKIVTPRKFSELICAHGSNLALDGLKSVTPYQILHPDYNSASPPLRVDTFSVSSSDVDSSASRQLESVGQTSDSYQQRLPPKKPYIPRALKHRSPDSCECGGNDDESSHQSTTTRKTIMELEAQLIQERQHLKRLQLESDMKKKVYAKTTRQMKAHLIENHQKAKVLLDAMKQARTGLERLEAEVYPSPISR